MEISDSQFVQLRADIEAERRNMGLKWFARGLLIGGVVVVVMIFT